ncbi:MAG: hypothetical protein AB7I27_14200 [Bacteriovoracaceae bacterium]
MRKFTITFMALLTTVMALHSRPSSAIDRLALSYSTRDAILVSTAPIWAVLCLADNGRRFGADACGLLVSTALTTTTAALLLKEIEEVKPDALAYEVTGESTLPLNAVIEKLQLIASEQGQDLSFEDSITLINMINQ